MTSFRFVSLLSMLIAAAIIDVASAGGDVDMSIIAYNEEHGVKGIERSEMEVRGLYEKWLVTHGKQYNALGEEGRRFEIFKDNLRFVDEHNAAADKGEHSFRLGMNKFADLTNEEYRSMYLGVKPGENRPKRVGVKSDRYKVHAGESLPDSVDWREKGSVAPVIDVASAGKGENPPNPGPSPPTSAKAPTVCDKYYSCPESTTCCCAYEFGLSCYAWGCCPLEGATCCDDHSCCPHDYPICNVKAGTCLKSKNNPLAVKAAVRTPAKPHWAFSSGDKQQ